MREKATHFTAFFRLQLSRNRALIPLIATFALVSLSFIPARTLITLFDKNSAPQFMSAMAMGVLLSILFFLKRGEIKVPLYLAFIALALLIFPLISNLLSTSPTQGLTGDTFRYNGLASLYFLIVVALLHGTLCLTQFIRAIKGYLAIIGLIDVIAVLQKFSLISLPGIQGTVTATFGNLDFLSALIGTSLPLILFAYLYSGRLGKYLSVGLFLLSTYVITLTGAKQGFLDLAMVILAVGGYLIYSKVKFRYFQEPLSIRAKTTVLTVLLLLWLEFIFTVPFANLNIPHVSNDPQVAIRGVLWLAALNQFKSSPWFGIGPDQYGNYYEQFRTVTSTIVLPGDSSNDAHSGFMQTLATLGLTGSLLFLTLFILLIYAALKLYRTQPEMKRPVQIISLFVFIFITNAAISPIVIANRFLIWAVGGFVVLYLYRNSEFSAKHLKISRSLLGVIAIVLIATLTFTAGVFGYSQARYLAWGEKNMNSKGAVQKVAIDPFLPCQYYFPDLVKYQGVLTASSVKEISLNRIKSNPRCYAAILQLARAAADTNDLPMMRKYVYTLIHLAPARRETLDIATIYAIRAKDKKLEEIVRRTFAKQGILILDVKP